MNDEFLKINEEKIFLDKTLVSFYGIPAFAVCRDTKGNYYLAISISDDCISYYLFRIKLSDLYSVLIGEIPIREALAKSNKIYYSENWSSYGMKKPTKRTPLKEVDKRVFPEPDVHFIIINKDVKYYVEHLKSNLNTE